MMDKAKISSYFGVNISQVEKWRLVDGGDTVRALINYGGGGIKVYEIPLEEFPEDLPLPAAVSIEDADYRQLQAMAKELDIPANQSRDDLISALEIEYAFADEEE